MRNSWDMAKRRKACESALIEDKASGRHWSAWHCRGVIQTLEELSGLVTDYEDEINSLRGRLRQLGVKP